MGNLKYILSHLSVTQYGIEWVIWILTAEQVQRALQLKSARIQFFCAPSNKHFKEEEQKGSWCWPAVLLRCTHPGARHRARGWLRWHQSHPCLKRRSAGAHYRSRPGAEVERGGGEIKAVKWRKGEQREQELERSVPRGRGQHREGGERWT